MGDKLWTKLGCTGAVFAALTLLGPGCAHDRGAPPPAQAIGGAGQAGQSEQPGDVDDAATEPPPGDDTDAMPLPRPQPAPGTGGSGPVPGQPPPLDEEGEPIDLIPDTAAPAPQTPRTRQQLEGDKAPGSAGNAEQVGPVGDQKQE